ncbi:MAG: PD40 domain-containing protein [Spirochaetes bacterium]|nr:PD40 domain-containing protein [Spirochaetota bacterium]
MKFVAAVLLLPFLIFAQDTSYILLSHDSSPEYDRNGKSVLISAITRYGDSIISLDRTSGKITLLAFGKDASYSPDGKSIIYITEYTNTNYTDIWLMDIAGNSNVCIAPNYSYTRRMPALSFDRKMVYYYRLFNAGSQIYGVDLKENNIIGFEFATFGLSRMYCTIDYKYLILSCQVSISRIDLKTKIKTELTGYKTGNDLEFQHFALTHDSKQIVYMGTKPETYENVDFYIKDIYQNTKDKFITNVSKGNYYSVAVSPDKKKLMFMQDMGDGYNYAWKYFKVKKNIPKIRLLEMNIDGTDLHEVILDPAKLVIKAPIIK